jgi:hypothetical protein
LFYCASDKIIGIFLENECSAGEINPVAKAKRIIAQTLLQYFHKCRSPTNLQISRGLRVLIVYSCYGFLNSPFGSGAALAFV